MFYCVSSLSRVGPELLKADSVKQPYGENVRNLHGDRGTEAGGRICCLAHIGRKKKPCLSEWEIVDMQIVSVI